MKVAVLLFSALFLCQAHAGAMKSISGTVVVGQKVKMLMPKKGVLYVFAKPFGKKHGPPLAVKRIAQPKFPVKFTLTSQDSMMPGLKLDGKVRITARFSPGGGVMPAPGSFEGVTGKVDVDHSKAVKVVIDKKL